MANFGGPTNLIAGTIKLILPPGTQYWYIQNQDTQPLMVAFPSGTGYSPIALDPASVTGGAGDWIDSVGFPFGGAFVTLTSSLPTAQFSSGASQNYPSNEYKGG